MGNKMYALVEMGCTDSFSKKNYQIFSDIDALAVSMSEKFCGACRRHAVASFKSDRISYVRTMFLLALNSEEEGGSGGVDDLKA